MSAPTPLVEKNKTTKHAGRPISFELQGLDEYQLYGTAKARICLMTLSLRLNEGEQCRC